MKTYEFPSQPQTFSTMSKRKAETLTQLLAANGSKKAKHSESPRLNKSNLLDDSDSSSEDESGGAALEDTGFKINAEYAKRFEYNKKREEKLKCEISVLTLEFSLIEV
jgi:hypothetical protein